VSWLQLVRDTGLPGSSPELSFLPAMPGHSELFCLQRDPCTAMSL